MAAVTPVAETLRSALSNARHEVDALTGKNWSGATATSFAEGWAEISDGGGKIIEALTTMASALGVTAKTCVAQAHETAHHEWIAAATEFVAGITEESSHHNPAPPGVRYHSDLRALIRQVAARVR